MTRTGDIRQKVNTILMGIVIFIILSLGILGIATFMMYKPILAEMEYKKGEDHHTQGYPIEARESMHKVIELAPDSSQAQKARNYLKYRLPKSDRISQEAIKHNIDGYNALYRGEYEKSIKYFDMAISESPNFEWPYCNSGLAYFYMKDYDKSIEAYQKVLKINSTYYNANYSIAASYFARGRKYIDDKNYEEAIDDFKKAIKYYNITLKQENFYNTEGTIKEYISDIKDYMALAKKKARSED